MDSKRYQRMCLTLVLALLIGTGGNANADFTFGTPTNLGPTVNSGKPDIDSSISSDGLSLYFNSTRSGGFGGWDIWVTTRVTTDGEWGPPVNLGSVVNSSSAEASPRIAEDGLTLFFISDRTGGYGGFDIWVTTRETKNDQWGAPVNLGSTINSSATDGIGSISPDSLTLYLISDRPGGYGAWDIYTATRSTVSDAWGQPVNLGPTINSSSEEGNPCVLPDGRTLVFSSDRPGGLGRHDLYVTTRATKDKEWGAPVNLGPTINTSAGDELPSISADGSTLYFSSNRADGNGGYDLWQVPIDPIVDLNGDGIVDSGDMSVMIDHWDEDYPLCDVGPTPVGDGTVDVQDLIVLSEHLFEDVDDPTLVAHWPLDETEGITARDNVNGYDDFIIGGAVWQPTGGKVGGALELDGVDDCLIATVGPNSADGAFSVVVWIKGGAPGQGIISQSVGANLLALDAEGKLMTDFGSSGQGSVQLESQAVITDGKWHRVSLVWDGSQRTLCVDGFVVAEDTPDGPGAAASGIYIGVGNNYTAGTFFSGLIDDVRIYNRAVKP